MSETLTKYLPDHAVKSAFELIVAHRVHLNTLGAPPVVIGPLVADKTIDICLPGDVICAGGGISLVHGNYAHTEAPAQAADFVAQRVF